jgi:hypothetical protein
VLLRNTVFALLFANLGYFAYSQGWLDAITGGDAKQREPQRLARQVNPESIRIEPSIAPKVAVQTVTEPTRECQTGEQWLVYMGPYANRALLEKKESELDQRQVAYSEVTKSSLPLGLSLGEFNSEKQARVALEKLSSQDVNTATVILWGKTNKPVKADACG